MGMAHIQTMQDDAKRLKRHLEKNRHLPNWQDEYSKVSDTLFRLDQMEATQRQGLDITRN
jgi:hypothetical protein